MKLTEPNQTNSKSAPFSPVTSALDPAYAERVYAGVLGKLIGVYLGRPVENWSYERIMEEIGTISYYVHEQRGRRLVITDDDISGMFTFLRALEDAGCSPDLTSAQIGETWLNYLIEKTTILWWGGMGNSTEHTAYLRLKRGINAPESGSIARNGIVVAEQIGAQIFIDGWGLICPGDPDSAARYAEKAARVSHDGEAIYGAKAVAAMVAQAFVEPTIEGLVETALRQMPAESTLAKVINDLIAWTSQESDWRENRARLEAEYGYSQFLGQCPLIPNHGLIILSLLQGRGSFDESMTIVNTSGWDTDCNSGNVGTILGVQGGLAAFTAQDWRGPVADRLYLPSADGGRAVTDAASEALWVANLGRKLAGESPLAPKDGARFHFALPGAVQGWMPGDSSCCSVLQDESKTALHIRCLSDQPGTAGTATFISPEIKDLVSGYVLVANPTLFPTQVVKARIFAGDQPVSGRLFLEHYNEEDLSEKILGPEWSLAPGDSIILEWEIPNTDGFPIHLIALELDSGEVWLDWLTWQGVPDTEFPIRPGKMTARGWAKSVDRFEHVRDRYDYITHNEGVGLLTQGHRDWSNYRIEARITPKMALAGGIALRVQGLRRWLAFVFAGENQVAIIKCKNEERQLAQTSFPWEPFKDYDVEVEVKGTEIRAWINGRLVLTAVDREDPLTGGAFGFIVKDGCLGAGTPRITPA